MRKLSLITAALLLILVPVSLMANGQDEAAADGAVKLRMFHYLDLADATTSANWDILLNTWKSSHPEIELEIEYLVNEPYHNKLQAMSVAGQLPDIMFLWPGKRTGQVTGSGQVKDLSPWLAGKEDMFSPAALTAQGPNGEIWELPEQVTATHVMFTNDRLLDELGLDFPETMDELIAQGDAIRAAGLIPIAMDNKDGWQMQSCMLSALVARTGGPDWFDKAIVGDASFEDDEFVQAVQIIKTLNDNEMFSPGINQAEYGRALTDFVTEKAVYFIDGGWRANNLVGELTAEQKQYMSLRVFPEISGADGLAASTAIVAGTGHGMNAKLEGAEADAAWEWIWFYSGPVGSAIRQGFGALPAYKLPVPGNADPMIKHLAEFVNTTPGGYVIDAKMDAEGMGVLHPALQKMMFGELTPAQVAAEYESWVAANDTGRK